MSDQLCDGILLPFVSFAYLSATAKDVGDEMQPTDAI